MPVRTFRHTATTNQPPDHAWKALQRAATWESVAGVDHVTEPSHRGDGTLIGFRFRATAAGQDFPGIASTTLVDPDARMVVTIETSDLDGMIDVQLSPNGSGSGVTVELTIRSKSILSGMFFSTIARVVEDGLDAQVQEFARRLDEG
jgi:carbon monoxide dehydrogenase subunit G